MESFGAGNSRVLPLVGPWLGRVVVLLAIVASAVPLGSGVEERTRDNASANLPGGSESAAAARIQQTLATDACPVALVVFDRDGEALTREDIAAVEARLPALAQEAPGCPEAFPVVAEDGEAMLVGVPLDGALAEDEVEGPVEQLREDSSADLPDGLRATVTGGPAFQVDLSNVFEGADVRLLIATALVVALLLLVTYRSPWLWLVPLTVVGVADRVALEAVAIGTRVFGFGVDGATVGITSVLVFGAGTNYALLLIARYREELRRHEDRYHAMRIAWRGSAPAILASAGTVVLALLCLGAASAPFTTSIGYAGAIGIVVALVYALLVLPAAMTLFGRRLFWPFVPRVGDRDPSVDGIWARAARFVTGHPWRVLAGGTVVLAALAIPALGVGAGLSQTEQFRAEPESVVGQRILAEHFPAGASQPTVLVTPVEQAAAVQESVRQVGAVRSIEEGGSDGEYAELRVVLDADPESSAAFAAIEEIRGAVAGTDTLVGGPDAEGLDSADGATRDRFVVIPLVFGVVLVVLLLLLRSAVAAVLLVLTVAATYVSALGAGWIVFTQVFDFPALDLSVPLLAFLFLVALGVDYNIFLATRAREEAARRPTKEAVTVALAVTGGVITSAGVLLAAVFTVLGVLPLITLTQLGIIVGIGVLLDTLLVRTVIVPALVSLLEERFWWPSVPGSPRTAVEETQTRV